MLSPVLITPFHPDDIAILDRIGAHESELFEASLFYLLGCKKHHGAAPQDDVQPTVASNHGSSPKKILPGIEASAFRVLKTSESTTLSAAWI